MGMLLVLSFVALLLTAAVLQLIKRRLLSTSLVAALPTFIVISLLADLARGVSRIGQAAYNADERQLLVSLPLLALCILAIARRNWWWLFWIVWVINAFIAAGLIYLQFFWKLFS